MSIVELVVEKGFVAYTTSSPIFSPSSLFNMYILNYFMTKIKIRKPLDGALFVLKLFIIYKREEIRCTSLYRLMIVNLTKSKNCPVSCYRDLPTCVSVLTYNGFYEYHWQLVDSIAL